MRQPRARCLTFSPDGSRVVAGFDDGSVRTYTPQSGRMVSSSQVMICQIFLEKQLFKQLDILCQGVHPGGVTAMSFVLGSYYLVTGGATGHVRSWEVGRRSGALSLLTTVKEHKGAVCNVQVAKDQREFLSGSKDGFCIIWDATKYA